VEGPTWNSEFKAGSDRASWTSQQNGRNPGLSKSMRYLSSTISQPGRRSKPPLTSCQNTKPASCTF